MRWASLSVAVAVAMLCAACEAMAPQSPEESLKVKGEPEEEFVAMYRVILTKGATRTDVGYVEKRAFFYPARANPVCEFIVSNSRLEEKGFVTESGKVFKYVRGKEEAEEVGEFALIQGISLILDVAGDLGLEEIDTTYIENVQLTE